MGLAFPPAQVGLELCCTGFVETAPHRLVNVSERTERAELTGPQHLVLVDIADPGGEPLIEQHLSNLGRLVRPGDPIEHHVEIDVGVAEIWAEMSQPVIGRRPDLDRGSSEAHGDVRLRLEHGTGEMAGSPPPLPLLVEMPDAGHVQVGAERQAPLDHDLEELSDCLNRTDHITDPEAIHAAGPHRDPGQGFAHQRRAELQRRVEEGVALGHQALASNRAASSANARVAASAPLETAPMIEKEWDSVPSQRCITVTPASVRLAA